MGCIFSRPRGAEPHNPRMFKVLNMDKDGLERNSGKIEITDSELVFHQKNKEPIRWPLKSLRRYGYDAELFSFESGRRCPTGQGIYAFKCARAEALFNLLQDSIQRAGQHGGTGNEETSPRLPVSVSSGGVVIDATQRPMSVADFHPTSTDPPVTQRQASHPPVMVPHTHPGSHNMHGVVTLQAFPQISSNRHEYINADTFQNGVTIPGMVDTADHPINSSSIKVDLSRQVSLVADPEPQIQYAELDLGGTAGGGVASAGGSTNQFQAAPPLSDNRGIESCHATYMNVASNGGGGSNGSRSSTLVSQSILSSSVPLNDAPLPPLIEEEHGMSENTVNYLNLGITPAKLKVTYIEVDFKNNESDSNTANGGIASHALHLANGSAMGAKMGVANGDAPPPIVGGANGAPTTDSYAVIDFHKTAAINAKNTTHLDDEGARKTRHNSNIDFT